MEYIRGCSPEESLCIGWERMDLSNVANAFASVASFLFVWHQLGLAKWWDNVTCGKNAYRVLDERPFACWESTSIISSSAASKASVMMGSVMA